MKEKGEARLQEDIAYLIHEILTPLSAIITSAGLLKETSWPEESREILLETIEQEGWRIEALLQDFSDALNRSSDDWLTDTVFSAVSVGALMEETALRFRNIPSRYCLRFSIPSEMPQLRADYEKMRLVLRNLIANAIKYSPEGGEIHVSAARSGDWIVLCVRDNGIGIPGESLERVFDPAFRVPQTEGRRWRGAGLGLAIVKRIVRAHGGEIQVESAPGKGSVFRILLPVFSPGQGADQPEGPEKGRAGIPESLPSRNPRSASVRCSRLSA